MCLCSLAMCPQVGGDHRAWEGERTEERLKEAELQESSATEHKDSKINRKKERLISGPKK